jgi:hypothetical protein
MKTRKYTHLELGTDILIGIGGSYMLDKEVRMKHSGKELLYVTGHTNIESACCGVSNWGYALVPGYIVSWQNQKDEKGLPLTEVEPITDEAVRQAVRQAIETQEAVIQVQFWGPM